MDAEPELRLPPPPPPAEVIGKADEFDPFDPAPGLFPDAPPPTVIGYHCAETVIPELDAAGGPV